jgi:Domain of unknown function (DUF5667)
MKENNTTETLLESQHTPLSRDKKEALWKNIEADIAKLPIASPYTFTMVTKKSMTSLALALVLMFSLGGTAYASNDARPGDILFPVDQALEEIRLALVRDDDSRAQLQIAFAEERLSELRSILAERTNGQTATSTNQTASTSPIVTFEAEADVFTNTTIVTVEINDRKTTFETSAKTKVSVIDEIVRRYTVDRNLVEKVLDFEIEDRASRVSDMSDATDDDDRIKTSIALLSALIDESDDDSRDRFISELLQTFGNGSNDDDDDFRFEQDDDEIEYRSDDSRMRIREKDGETRIEIRSGDDNDDDNDDDRNDDDSSDDRDDDDVRFGDDDSDSNNDDDDSNSNSSDDSSSDDNSNDDSNDDSSDDSNDDSNDESSDDSDNQVKIEVRVEDGRAEVRMEYGSRRDEFTTAYTSKSALVTELAARSGLSQSVIEGNLDLEIED